MRKLVLLAVILSMLINTSVFAMQDEGLIPYASHYLDEFSVVLSAEGDAEMCVSVSVDGVGKQDKIGVASIDIEERSGNGWVYFDTLYAADNPDFYDYNSYDYMGDAYFEGTPGVEYRVIVYVYAEKDGGSDTRSITSESCVCR